MAAVDISTIKAALIAWVQGNDGLADNRVVWGEPNAPRPDLPYVQLKITSLARVGEDYRPQPEDVAGTVKITGNRDFVVPIQAFGVGSLGILEDLRSSTEKVSVRDAFGAAKFCVFDTGDVLDTTELIESRYREQGSLDLFMRTYSEVTDVLGTIAKAEVEETYTDANNQTVLTDTYTIDTTT